MKIVCATDFSPPAVSGAQVAARLAKRLGDSLVLAHTVEPPAALYPELMVSGRMFEQAMRDTAAASLRAAAAELRALGVEVEERVLIGFPVEMTTDLGRELGARLIVVGTHGHRSVPRMFLGSVAERIAVNSDRPVLVVRNADDAIAEWADGSRHLRITVGVDLSNASRAAVEWVRTLRQAGPCDVRFVNAYSPPEERERLGLRGPRLDIEATTTRVLERELSAIIGQVPGAGTTETRIVSCWGAEAALLASEADQESADLLVVGRSRRTGMKRLLGPTAQAVLRAAGMPVLVVPETPEARARVSVPRITTVLAPTDLSAHGDAAVAHAFTMVKATGGVVELCHVHHGALDPQRLGQIEDHLRALIPEEAYDYGVSARLVVSDDARAGDEIVRIANRLGVDAICMGSHGHSGFGKALLGSVAETVIQKAGRPVMVVPAARE